MTMTPERAAWLRSLRVGDAVTLVRQPDDFDRILFDRQEERACATITDATAREILVEWHGWEVVIYRSYGDTRDKRYRIKAQAKEGGE